MLGCIVVGRTRRTQPGDPRVTDARIQRRLAAIAFADVIGYSRMMGADEQVRNRVDTADIAEGMRMAIIPDEPAEVASSHCAGTAEPLWVGDVLRFWFEELRGADWFAKRDELDARIRERFLASHESLVSLDGRVDATPRTLLAAVIVLDQFSRNMFRGSPRAYAADPIARRLARLAIERGFDQGMTRPQRMFLYLPFEHSEDAADQAYSLQLFEALGDHDWTDYAHRHKAIVDRFGRFPHRNAVLGRASTAEEIDFLKSSGSGF